MSLLKRTVTPARLAANRRSALKSTGPLTAAGKARSSLNALRHGGRSKTYELLWSILLQAPPCGVIRMARAYMSPAQLALPHVARMLNLFLSDSDTPLEPDPVRRPVVEVENWFSAVSVDRKNFDSLRSKPKSLLESAGK
jgi:hypothetical protein